MTKHIIEATLKNGVIWELSCTPAELKDMTDYMADNYFNSRIIDFKIDGVLWDESTYDVEAQ